MITATLKRNYHNAQTTGQLVVKENGNIIFICDTIELPWRNNERQISCIPEGKYNVVYRESQKYPRHYHLLNVPKRDFILIHQANYAGSANPRTRKPDLLGCIGVGSGYADLNSDGIVELLRSKATLDRMLAVIGKRSFELTVLS